jgi:hypothetical protein
MTVLWLECWFFGGETQKQIPFGNDKQKSKSNEKNINKSSVCAKDDMGEEWRC